MLRFTVMSCTMLIAAHVVTATQPSNSPSPFCQCEIHPNDLGTQPVATLAAQIDAEGHKKGDITYYDLGLGACGMDDSGKDDTDSIVALSHLLMGEKSNDNPFCGRTITIRLGDKTATAVVRDKCMGCAAEDIDVSRVVFTGLVGELGRGRVSVDWWFN